MPDPNRNIVPHPDSTTRFVTFLYLYIIVYCKFYRTLSYVYFAVYVKMQIIISSFFKVAYYSCIQTLCEIDVFVLKQFNMVGHIAGPVRQETGDVRRET